MQAVKAKKRRSPLEERLLEYQRMVRLQKRILKHGEKNNPVVTLALDMIKRKIGE